MGEIKPDAHNYRLHDERNLKLIKKSLKECGFGRSIVADADGEIIAGNATYQMLKELGLPIQVIPTDGKTGIILQRTDLKTQDKARKKLAAIDNSASDLSTFNYPELLADFTKDELPEIGIDEIPVIEEEKTEVTEDEVPEEVETKCKPGDIWQLGEHRLMCGDSTVITDLEKLMNGEKADMVFTDPPYGISVVKSQKVGGGGPLHFGGKTSAKIIPSSTYKEVENDNTTETAKDFYSTCISLSFDKFIIFGGNYFTDFLPPHACWVVWDKQNTGNFADVELAWTSFDKGAKLYKFMWNGLCREGSRAIEGKKRVHPTQKPVGLITNILNDFTNKDEVVYDGFGGSGSTLIACEQLNRKCRMMELDAHYCTVILERYINFKGSSEDVFLINEDGTKTKYEDVVNAKR